MDTGEVTEASVHPSESASLSARDQVIARKRKRLEIKDIWYHFEKKGKSVICYYCDSPIALNWSYTPWMKGLLLLK